jgi:hypothetical protein
MMNLHKEYLEQFPDRKIFRTDGKLTKNYKEWLKTKQSPLMKKQLEDERKWNKELAEWYQKEQKKVKKKIKKHKDKRTKSFRAIEQMGSREKVEEFLNS